ncbi:hypothetical protein PSCLAVI8L_120078 [Pseudoclavibacter sp. 8L]|nr:hypothetical protein PSCLAVI8L_120078 [Pseudoclavibacter sp. 8L]
MMSSCPQSWHVAGDWTSSSKQCYALSVATETERHAPLAQLAEQLTLNQWVLGSSPRGCTR